VVIEREGSGALDKDKYQQADNSPEYFQTHFELMRSHKVLKRAAQLLQLSAQPEYQPRPSAIKAKILGLLPEAIGVWLKPSENVAATSEDEKEDRLLKSF